MHDPHEDAPHQDTPHDNTSHGHPHDAEAPGAVTERWKHDGVRVIPGDQLDPNTAQTPGMFRQAAINHARVGAQKIWAGTVAIQPDAKTGVHHHGALESVIYVVSRPGPDALGRAARIRRRGRPGRLHLRAALRAAPGDQRLDPTSRCNACWCAPTTRRWWSTSPMSSRSSSRKTVYWVDPIHKHP